MARVKVSITEIEGKPDRASGFDDTDPAVAADRAIAYLVEQVRPGAVVETPKAEPVAAPTPEPVAKTPAATPAPKAKGKSKPA